MATVRIDARHNWGVVGIKEHSAMSGPSVGSLARQLKFSDAVEKHRNACRENAVLGSGRKAMMIRILRRMKKDGFFMEGVDQQIK